MSFSRRRAVWRYLIPLLTVAMIVGVVGGIALADVSTANQHGPSTEATHTDTNGVGPYCSNGWKASAYVEQRSFDNKSHTEELRVRDYWSSSMTTMYAPFTTSTTKLLKTIYTGSDFVSSFVDPIHWWTDLVPPRFTHYMASGCSPP